MTCNVSGGAGAAAVGALAGGHGPVQLAAMPSQTETLIACIQGDGTFAEAEHARAFARISALADRAPSGWHLRIDRMAR